METVNITLKIEKDEILSFESWLGQQLNIIDFRILPDTEMLYEKDDTFKQLVKKVKDAQRFRDIYINNHNYKSLK